MKKKLSTLGLFTLLSLGIISTQVFADDIPQKSLKLLIPKETQKKFPRLVRAIKSLKSTDNKYRNSWLEALPSMTMDQVIELRNIISEEKRKLAQIEKKHDSSSHNKMVDIQGNNISSDLNIEDVKNWVMATLTIEQKNRRDKFNGTMPPMPDEISRDKKIEYILYFRDAIETNCKVLQHLFNALDNDYLIIKRFSIKTGNNLLETNYKGIMNSMEEYIQAGNTSIKNINNFSFNILKKDKLDKQYMFIYANYQLSIQKFFIQINNYNMGKLSKDNRQIIIYELNRE